MSNQTVYTSTCDRCSKSFTPSDYINDIVPPELRDAYQTDDNIRDGDGWDPETIHAACMVREDIVLYPVYFDPSDGGLSTTPPTPFNITSTIQYLTHHLKQLSEVDDFDYEWVGPNTEEHNFLTILLTNGVNIHLTVDRVYQPEEV